MTLYEILGVATDATADVIKKAFRSLAQKHHPDKGGDHATMQEVQKAYDVLGDAERRAHYDETGGTDPVSSLEARARVALADMINKAIEKLGESGEDALEYIDPLQRVRDGVHSVKLGNAEVIEQLGRRIRQRKTALKRLVRKEGDGPNVIVDAVKASVAELEGLVKEVREKQAVIHKVLDLLAEYDYVVDQRMPQPIWTPMPTASWAPMT